MSDNLRVVHANVPGRLRIKVPALSRNPPLARRLERELRAHDFQLVRANDTTATVLVTYPVPRGTDAVLDVVAEALTTAANPKPPAPLKAWWCMSEQQTLLDVSASLSGLTTAEAAHRYRMFGANLPFEIAPSSRWTLFVSQFNSLPIMLLCASTAFSVVTGGLLDAGLMIGVIAGNVGIGYWTEAQAERVISSYMKNERPVAMVRRDGYLREIASEHLVPGDVIVLTPGNVLTTDVRILASNELTLDESLLTGESAPVLKSTTALTTSSLAIGDRQNMAFSGTMVTSGGGIAVVVATGTHTEISHISAAMAETEKSQTPMQRQLDRLARQMTFASLIGAGAVFGLGFLRGASLVDLIRTSIALAVAAIPEGLPSAATSILASGLREMQQHNVLIRRLVAVETLGSVSVLCFDKTGTLTQNRMTATTIITNGHRFSVVNGFNYQGAEVTPTQYPTLMELLRVAALCSDAEVTDGRDTSVVNGSATESALLLLAIRAGINVSELRKAYPMSLVSLRSDQRRHMRTTHVAGSQVYTAVKGSPLDVLSLCDRYMDDSAVHHLGHARRGEIIAENNDMTQRGQRVLGFAYDRRTEDAEADLIWLGMVGLTDPARPGMAALIDQFHDAGIRTVMLTGDQPGTALSVASELGLSDDAILLIDAAAMPQTPSSQLAAIVPEVDVFSRVSPIHKLNIVQALQASGSVVAMTGDGTNDGPALRAADVGVTMGTNGTDAARAVADVILAKDDLTTMIIAIREGRTIYSNIRKAVQFLVGTNSSEVMLTLAAASLGAGRPLNPAQLLWLNLVTDVAIAYSLGFEPPEADVMTRPPRPIDEQIITGADYRRLWTKAGLFSGSALATHFYGMHRYGPGGGGIAFASLTAAQLFDGFSSRSETERAWNLPPNPTLRRSILGLLGLQAAAMLWPVSRSLLGVARLDWLDMGVISLGSALPFLATELSKRGRSTASQEIQEPESVP